MAWLHEGESTESNGCKNKQLDSTYELHSQPEEAGAWLSEDDSTKGEWPEYTTKKPEGKKKTRKKSKSMMFQ